MQNKKTKAKVCQAGKKDIQRMVEIHNICFKPPFPQELKWTPKDLEFAINHFPQGQLVAEVDGTVAGHIISNRVSEELYRSHPPLLEFIGIDPPWYRFDQTGSTMWILEIAVDPSFSGCGSARALVQACKKVVMDTQGLTRFGGGARIPGYAGWKEKTGGNPEMYCQEVVKGQIFDPVLGPFLKFGTRLDHVAAGYVPDPESLDYGACVIWERGMD